jgi:hypothetical protein
MSVECTSAAQVVRAFVRRSGRNPRQASRCILRSTSTTHGKSWPSRARTCAVCVVDRDSEDIGQVDGLLVDEAARRVQFLQVGSGRFLGLGNEARLSPTHAITTVGQAALRVGTKRE